MFFVQILYCLFLLKILTEIWTIIFHVKNILLFGDQVFGDKLFGDQVFGDKLFGDKVFGDKLFGDSSSFSTFNGLFVGVFIFSCTPSSLPKILFSCLFI